MDIIQRVLLHGALIAPVSASPEWKRGMSGTLGPLLGGFPILGAFASLPSCVPPLDGPRRVFEMPAKDFAPAQAVRPSGGGAVLSGSQRTAEGWA